MSNRQWKRVHNFHDSLKFGQASERAFLELWPGLVQLDGRKADFIIEATGETVELKSDRYDATTTANFFIERWSDFNAKKPGGPWQSEATYYVYYFVQNQIAYVFKTAELREFLNTQKFSNVSVQNRGWTTVGYKVPRTLCEHLCHILEFKK